MTAADFSWMLAIPVLLPFVGAALALVLAKRPRTQRIVSVATLAIVLVDALFLLVITASGPITLDVGGWAAPVGITLVGDRLSALMLVVSVFVTLCVLIFSSTQEIDESKRLPLAIYQPTFLILSAGVSNAFLTGDLFNLYVGFEILLVSSFVLITLGGTRDRMRSGAVYVVVSVVSSTIFLVGLAMTYAATGTVNMAQLAIRLPEIDPGVAALIQVVFLVAFGVKAAVFPLSAWLPDSYPTAPAPVTAVFAGLLTKVGVYAIIRTQTIIFAESRLNTLLLVIGMATMVIGILGAVAQDDIKRLLSFTLVSHIGFMLWGVGTGGVDALTAAIFYTAHHIIVQTALFLVAGIMERVGGTTSLVKLGSLMKLYPFLAVLFLVPALNLSGVPPLSGFIGKVGLIQASAASGRPIDWVLIAGGLVSSLLTLYALIRAWNMAFWQPADTPPKPQRIPLLMSGSATAIVCASLMLTIFAAPVYQFVRAAAVELEAQAPYVVAVFPDAERGTGQSHTQTEEEPAPQPSTTVTPPLEATPSASSSQTSTASAATSTPSPSVEDSESGGEQ